MDKVSVEAIREVLNRGDFLTGDYIEDGTDINGGLLTEKIIAEIIEEDAKLKFKR